MEEAHCLKVLAAFFGLRIAERSNRISGNDVIEGGDREGRDYPVHAAVEACENREVHGESK